MRIFVTGGTGVLGRPVVRMAAAAGHTVRALSRSASNDEMLSRLGAEPVRGDLFDIASLREAVKGSEGVLHLATAVRTPVVAIFGPSNYRAWGPWAPGGTAVVLRSAPE